MVKFYKKGKGIITALSLPQNTTEFEFVKLFKKVLKSIEHYMEIYALIDCSLLQDSMMELGKYRILECIGVCETSTIKSQVLLSERGSTKITSALIQSSNSFKKVTVIYTKNLISAHNWILQQDPAY